MMQLSNLNLLDMEDNIKCDVNQDDLEPAEEEFMEEDYLEDNIYKEEYLLESNSYDEVRDEVKTKYAIVDCSVDLNAIDVANFLKNSKRSSKTVVSSDFAQVQQPAEVNTHEICELCGKKYSKKYITTHVKTHQAEAKKYECK